MRPILPALLSILLLAGAARAQDEQPDNRSVHWQSHREAVALSRAEQRPLLMHFEADWCKWCRKMDVGTYRDLRVIRYLNEHFAMTRIDTERLPAMARKYGVDGLPTLWFLDPAGRRLTHVPGYMDADTLLPLLEFIATGAYETWDYARWLERRKGSRG